MEMIKLGDRCTKFNDGVGTHGIALAGGRLCARCKRYRGEWPHLNPGESGDIHVLCDRGKSK